VVNECHKKDNHRESIEPALIGAVKIILGEEILHEDDDGMKR